MTAGDPVSPQRAAGDGSVTATQRWTDAEGLHVDVRGLQPPQPLVVILELVEAAAGNTPIIVHHDRDPKFLYPELAERGWIAVLLDAPPGEVRLKLERIA